MALMTDEDDPRAHGETHAAHRHVPHPTEALAPPAVPGVPVVSSTPLAADAPVAGTPSAPVVDRVRALVRDRGTDPLVDPRAVRAARCLRRKAA